jgi:hypothetical protein
MTDFFPTRGKYSCSEGNRRETRIDVGSSRATRESLAQLPGAARTPTATLIDGAAAGEDIRSTSNQAGARRHLYTCIGDPRTAPAAVGVPVVDRGTRCDRIRAGADALGELGGGPAAGGPGT